MVQTIDVTSTSAAVTVAGFVVTIDPPRNLAAGTGYYVEIDAGAVEDLHGNDFDSGGLAWNFTTAGLLDNWTFDDTLNDATGGNDGTWNGTGSATYTTDHNGNANGAVLLNGTDQYVAASDVGYPAGSAMTSDGSTWGFVSGISSGSLGEVLDLVPEIAGPDTLILNGPAGSRTGVQMTRIRAGTLFIFK